MISDETLAKAVARGIITAAQADQIRALAGVDAPPQDPEKLRFLTGFGDIFVAIGVILFQIALGIFIAGAGLAVAGAALALVAWGLAEFFTRKRRMALPSILLLISFVGAVFCGVLGLVPGIADAPFDPLPKAEILIVPALAAAAAACLHYWRFRLPVAPAAGGGALMVLLVALLYIALPDRAAMLLPYLLILGGMAFFVLALRLDFSDPDRQTRRTDIAFWLHLLAAPMIVHPVMHWINALDESGSHLLTLGLFALLAVIALAADRRAILVSGLIYAGAAFSYLTHSGIFGGDLSAPLSLLFLGALILLLSAGWQTIRRGLLRALPPAIRRALPQPTGNPTGG